MLYILVTIKNELLWRRKLFDYHWKCKRNKFTSNYFVYWLIWKNNNAILQVNWIEIHLQLKVYGIPFCKLIVSSNFRNIWSYWVGSVQHYVRYCCMRSLLGHSGVPKLVAFSERLLFLRCFHFSSSGYDLWQTDNKVRHFYDTNKGTKLKIILS